MQQRMVDVGVAGRLLVRTMGWQKGPDPSCSNTDRRLEKDCRAARRRPAMAGGVPSKTRGSLSYEPINLSLSFLLLLTQRAEVYAWAAARRLSWPVQSVRRDREEIKAFN